MARGISTPLILLLILAIAIVNSKSAPGTLQAAPDVLEDVKSQTSRSVDFAEDTPEESIKARGENNSEDIGCDDDEEGDEYEGELEEDDNEYEDELRAAAESLEDTSKDETNSSSTSSAIEAKHDQEKQYATIKLDVPNKESDEDDEDEKVFELRNSKEKKATSPKAKRIPTVKKELSTQKEILAVSNETQVPKSLLSNEEIFNRLAEDSGDSPGTKVLDRNELADEERLKDGVFFDRPSQRSGLNALDSDYTDVDERPEVAKFNKRREVVLKDLKDNLLEEYTEEQEKQILENIGEAAATENLLKLLVKLAEDPKRWRRVQRLLMDFENGLELSRQALEARKRNLIPDHLLNSASTVSSVGEARKTAAKTRKKPRRKKPRRHRLSTQAPTTTVPVTLMPLTTTETLWANTPVSRRLITEKLFGSSVPDNTNEKLKSMRYSMLTAARKPPTDRQVIDNGQQDHLNSQQEALELNPAREFPQSRLLHYGKVNTRQSSTGVGLRHEQPTVYDGDDDAVRIRNYDPIQRAFKLPRYDHYGPLPNDFLRNNDRSFSDNFESPARSSPRSSDYKGLLGLDLGSSADWQESQIRYESPWNLGKSRPSNAASNKWSWQQPSRDYNKLWLSKTLWQNDRDYWSRFADEPEKKPWDQHRRQQQPAWRTNSWSEEKLLHEPTWNEKSKSYDRQVQKPWGKSTLNKNVLEPKSGSTKQNISDKSDVPKITMKTWTSLTSDPATWPFKLPGAKPWPKDENGKSYNPNADLVRKLGLNNQSRLLADNVSGGKEEYKPNGTDGKNVKILGSESGKDFATWPIKDQEWSKSKNPENLSLIDDTGAWPGVMNSGRKTSWKPIESFEAEVSGKGQGWPLRTASDERIWSSKTERGSWSQKLNDDWNVDFGKSSRTSATWPAKWKQFAYHRVTALPLSKAGTTLEGSAKPKNAYIAVSAVSSPKYVNNEWRKNDIEDVPVHNPKSIDPDHPTSQLRDVEERSIYAWKKNGGNVAKNQGKSERNDPLEHQLEELRLNEVSNSRNEIGETTTIAMSPSASAAASNASKGRHDGNLTKERDKRLVSHQHQKFLEE